MRRPIVTYFVTFIALIVAVYLRWLLDPVFGETLPFITLFGAIAIAAWIGGWRQATLAAILGYLAVDYLFMAPRGAIGFRAAADLMIPATFLFSAAIIIGFGETARGARRLHEELAQRHQQLLRPMSATGDEALRAHRLTDISTLGYLLVLLLLVAGGAGIYLNSNRLSENQRSVVHSQNVFLDIEQLLSRLQDAETGQRGFLLTGDAAYLRPYDAALPAIDERLGRLRILSAGERELQQGIAEIEPLIRAKLAELGRTIALARGRERAKAMEIVETDRGKVLMDQIRSEILGLEQTEQRLLARRAQQSEASFRGLVLWNFVEVAIGAVMIGLVFLLSRRNLRQRMASTELLAAQHERLRVTLSSIGDGVITTDSDSCITYLNPVAESLTGWASDEAVGKPLETVFRIVNETSREPVENPARRALREGVIVGLANHTALISKQGVAQSIDDSAAPIRGAQGEVIGCVLVFRYVGEKRRDEQAMHQQLENARILAAIVESSGDGIIGLSLDGVIQSWNSAAQRLFGHRAEAAVGRHIALIIPPDRATEEDLILSRIRSGERVEHFETVRLRDDGTPVHVSLTISPIVDERGTVVGVSKTARDITDRKRNEEVIYGLMRELKEGDRRKDAFLAMLAHELRGPLAPLRNTLEIMKRAEANPQVLQQARGTMERQLGQLIRLVDDLLDVSRITRDRLELRREPVELASVVHQSVEATRPVAEASQHEIRLDLPPEPVYVYADPVRLVQVLGNLLNNACKYTRPGGQISLTVKHEVGEVIVTVADTGMGIPHDKLESIFEMFTQIDRTLDRAEGGLGIGLTLVRRLAEMHGGSVEAHSEGLGRGSRFVVRLPELARGTEPATTRSAPSQDTPRRRILVVDDNVDSAESLALLLRMAGHEVHMEHDGLGAIERAGELRPDVVLLDIGLPRLSGHEACLRIREHDWGRSMYIVAMTGWGQEEDRQKSKEAGFDYHMTKPADFDTLMKLVAGVPTRGA